MALRALAKMVTEKEKMATASRAMKSTSATTLPTTNASQTLIVLTPPEVIRVLAKMAILPTIVVLLTGSLLRVRGSLAEHALISLWTAAVGVYVLHVMVPGSAVRAGQRSLGDRRKLTSAPPSRLHSAVPVYLTSTYIDVRRMYADCMCVCMYVRRISHKGSQMWAAPF